MAQEPARPSPRRPDETTSDRLDSWKDVAAYLQRDVSTVQRWEKREAMPVHRHVHEKQGTVYAFRRSTIERTGGIYGEDCRPLLIDASDSLSIDSPADWDEAERLLARR